ncbi:MAG: hypothetical protein WD598_03325 [Acidimicrobiia bacterium]
MGFGDSDPLGDAIRASDHAEAVSEYERKQPEAQRAALDAADELNTAQQALGKRAFGVVYHDHPITSAFEFLLILLALIGVAIAALIWQSFFADDEPADGEVATAVDPKELLGRLQQQDDNSGRQGSNPGATKDDGSADGSQPPSAGVDVSGTYALNVQYAGGASLPDPQYCDPLLTDTVVFDHKGKVLELTVNGINFTGSISNRLKFDLSASVEDITFTLTGDFFPHQAPRPTEVKGTQTHSLQRRTCIYSFRGTKSS